MKIHIYYLTVVGFTADTTHKPCLLEINELVGSGAGRKSAVNIKEIWGDSGMESEMFIGSESVRQESKYKTIKLGKSFGIMKCFLFLD